MKREQIIEILERFINEPEDYPDCILKYDFSRVADAILTIPLDVPSDEEIENYLWEEIHVPLSEHDRLNNTLPYKIYKETFLWVRWMRDEIIKRNK